MNNKHLFSNYYLENQITSTSEWQKQDHESVFQEIKKIYDREMAFVDNLNESQLEDRFFRKIFKVLLPHYEVQGVTIDKEFPDYAFFPDRDSQDQAQSRKDTESFFNEAFAVGEVKRWDVKLDVFGKSKHDKRRNPSFQIWLYLHNTEPRWGVLSNGRKWRLYHQDKPLDIYYEVDLVAILEQGDLEGFRYFYYFFREAAFLPTEKGEVFLEVVLKGSADYAQEIGDNLKENVYRAMKNISEGFFAWPENGLDSEDFESRALVQKNTMILLYRFLFLLYAEGKSLLDLRDEQYREFYSFDRIKKKVAGREDGPKKGRYPSTRTSLWGDLGDLFRLINRGSCELGIDDQIHVPAYNGGLFDPDKHPYLEKWILGDSYLAEAIDLLSRSEVLDGAKGAMGFVDYSTLEIRHLGSIYEGLLEYRLAVAEEDLVVSGGKDRRWLCLADFNKGKKKQKSFEEFGEFDRVKAGELYLTTDKGERKATGSYYTPDYIVNYIVENTVGPVVEERWKEALLNNQSLIGATLSVKVLDPAMGSGHFLVGAVEYLAGKLMRAAESDIEWGWVEDKGQFTNEWAKREVVSHCVYGVDLNELAVELAKVSLWLTTIAKDKPLSFLDHRLKQGNSLVGAHLSDLKLYPGEKVQAKDKADGQVTLPSFVSPRFLQHLIGKIEELEGIGDESLSEVKRKEKVFEEFRALPEYTKAKAIANVHTAVYFGNEVEPRTTPQGTKSADMIYHDLFWAVGGDDKEWRRKTSSPWFNRAQEISEDRRFFHWELEFPEIFFEGGVVKESPGWDAVVGNPPYVRQETLGDLKGYFQAAYKAYHGVADLYVYFFEKGHELLHAGGSFGFISSNKFMRSNYGKPLRKYLRYGIRIKEIVDFGELPVFPEAATFPAIYLTKRESSDNPTVYAQVQYLGFNSLDKIVNEVGLSLSPNAFDDENWTLQDENEIKIMGKMDSKSAHLGEYVNGEIRRGILTGFNKAFFIDKSTKERLIAEDPKSEEIIKPLVVGDDIRKYEIQYKERYLIWTYIGIDIENYPSIKNHLDQFKEKLERRYDKGKFYYELRACDYYADFEKPKIIYPDISKDRRLTFDPDGLYLANTAYFIPTDDLYLLTLLNSRLIFTYYKQISTTLGDANKGGRMRWFTQDVLRLPIRRINFTTPEGVRQRRASELKELYAAQKFDTLLERINDLLPKDEEGQLPSEGEKSDVIHDLLAFLAETMMELNRQKQDEIKGFLEWLEGDMGAKVFDLSNKTKVQAYYDHEVGELLAILKKNKRKVATDYSTRKPQDRLKKEFESSVNELRPLLARIENTDRLIDQVVYKLYGLTDEEIEIVEKSLE